MFLASLDYKVRPCLNTKTKKQTKKVVHGLLSLFTEVDKKGKWLTPLTKVTI